MSSDFAIESCSAESSLRVDPFYGCEEASVEQAAPIEQAPPKEDFQSWDRTLLNLSSKLAEPFCAIWALGYRMVTPLDPQKFENCNTVAKEVATRTFIGLGACLTAALCVAAPIPVLGTVLAVGVGSRALRAIGFALQKDGYTHVRGEGAEKVLSAEHPEVKVASWNVCGIGGGLSLDHGGVLPWQYRIDAIVQKIKDEDPDVLVLQEIYDTAFGEALIERLKTDYAHFYMHLGPNAMGSVGGLMVMSKYAPSSFSHTSFDNNSWTLNRGFATLELKDTNGQPRIRIIGTHLIHGDEPKDQANRVEQVAQIVNRIAQQALPTILMGDLNIERDREGGDIFRQFDHMYQSDRPTCTNKMLAQWDPKKDGPDEMIDYISAFRQEGQDVVFENGHLIEAFDGTYNTKTALSDHHGLAVTVRVGPR